jgi:5-methylcytosine-specific restriction endonuclease McrA
MPRNQRPPLFRPLHQRTDAQRRADWERASRRPHGAGRGYDWTWAATARAFLAAHPTCCRCGAVAEVVDHITPLHLASDRKHDPDNLAAMCRSCHARKTAADRAAGRTRRDRG